MTIAAAPARRAADQPAPPRRFAPETRVVLLSIVIAAAALVTLGLAEQWVEGGSANRDDVRWALPVTVLVFGVLEYLVYHVHVRGEPMSVSLAEVPIAFAVVFLSPPLAVLARVPLVLLVLIAVRRAAWYKIVFNVALFVFEVVLASVVYRALVEVWGDDYRAMVAAAAVAVVAIHPVGLLLVPAAIAQFGAAWRTQVAAELKATWWTMVVNTGLAAMTVALAVIWPPLGLLAIAPLLGVWYIERQYGDQLQQLRDLRDVHGFAGLVGSSLDLTEIGDTAVAETRRLLRAHGAALVRFERGWAAHVHTDGDVPVVLPEAVTDFGWSGVLTAREPMLLSPDDLRLAGIVAAVPAAVLVAPIHDDDGPLAVLLAVERSEQSFRFDIAELERIDNLSSQLATALRRGLLHERLEYEARHDALTDLPNRTLFERAVADAVAHPDTGQCVAVMMLDLDRFKEVNDTLGHHAGDEVLVTFAQRVGALLEPGDVLSRLSGDEFAVLCRRPDQSDVGSFAADLVRAAGEPVVIDGLEIVVTGSAGVAVLKASDHDALQPIRRADIAMYNAKWQRSGVEFYRDEIDRRTPARLSMLGDLRTAIHTDQLDVVYQPKLHIARGEVIGLEALVRWEHPTRGVVKPAEFVRVAEDTGLIKELTDLVLARSIAQMAELRSQGIEIGVAVNLSTHDLFDNRLPGRVRAYLHEHGVPPEQLTLEITESSLFVDAPRTRHTINGLHECGLRLAVDDFGTGYSSLAYLRQLPVQELKIDWSFVTKMLDDAQDEVIVRSTVELGHNLGLQVVAEGVESLDVLQRLAEMGCDIAQGYCISQPIRSAELPAWLLEVRAAAAEGRRQPWQWVASSTSN